MPYEFRFYINHELHFHSRLVAENCTAQKKNGQGCKNICCIGSPYCWTHLLYIKNLRIKPSNIPQAGKGLFAMDPLTNDTKKVFSKGERIVEYDGELMHHAELERRYGEYTAPYGVMISQNRDLYEDAALHRGVGSLCNQPPPNRKKKLFLLFQVKKYYFRCFRRVFYYYYKFYGFFISTAGPSPAKVLFLYRGFIVVLSLAIGN